MTRREFLEAVGLVLTGALAGFLTGRALVGEEVEEGSWRSCGQPGCFMEEDLVAYLDGMSIANTRSLPTPVVRRERGGGISLVGWM